jgi:hypothetical protein
LILKREFSQKKATIKVNAVKDISSAREYSVFRIVPKTNNPINDITIAINYFIQIAANGFVYG